MLSILLVVGLLSSQAFSMSIGGLVKESYWDVDSEQLGYLPMVKNENSVLKKFKALGLKDRTKRSPTEEFGERNYGPYYNEDANIRRKRLVSAQSSNLDLMNGVEQESFANIRPIERPDFFEPEESLESIERPEIIE